MPAYRVLIPTMAVLAKNARQISETIATGTIVTLDNPDKLHTNGLIEVRVLEHLAWMFAQDLRAKAVEVKTATGEVPPDLAHEEGLG